MQVKFTSPEYQKDGSFRQASYLFEGGPSEGWKIEREGVPHLTLGPGYRLLTVEQCGICSTDLARRFLPFPLPQITGHEIVARDEAGERFAVEINASHRARGIEEGCQFCNAGLQTHCPDRLVLGIHDLPGGFGPYILAPVHALIPIPPSLPSRSAVLIEPLAAAFNAVTVIRPRAKDRIAVLGPRRLGMLIVAALRAYRERESISFSIIALSKHPHLLNLSREIGADETCVVTGKGESLPSSFVDVVVDTTGNPDGFELAIRLARREVHLKSTHGKPMAGLKHLTEFVVDELNFVPYSADSQNFKTLSRLDGQNPPSAKELLKNLEATPPSQGVPRADAAVVDRIEQVDEVIRPDTGREVSLVKPRGHIFWMDRKAHVTSPLVEAVQKRGLKLSSSRCGDFRYTLETMLQNSALRGIGETLVTHVCSPQKMGEAFTLAQSAECIKAVVEQDSE